MCTQMQRLSEVHKMLKKIDEIKRATPNLHHQLQYLSSLPSSRIERLLSIEKRLQRAEPTFEEADQALASVVVESKDGPQPPLVPPRLVRTDPVISPLQLPTPALAISSSFSPSSSCSPMPRMHLAQRSSRIAADPNMELSSSHGQELDLAWLERSLV